MRQFFKFAFATVVGLFLFCFIGFLFLMALAGAAASGKEEKIKPNSVLELKLNYDIPDRTKSEQFNFNFTSFEMNSELGLNDILENIEKAKTDDNIKGIFLNLSTTATGFGILEEIRNKLLEFKETGKFVVAYGEVMTQKAYYIASVADEIYLNPKGVIALQGFSAELTFFKNALDRLGIEPEVFYAGNFKSATEPFRYNKMSDYNRLQIRELLNGVYGSFVAQVAPARKMTEAQLSDIINNLKIQNADDAKQYGIVTDLYYIDQLYDNLRNKLGLDEDDKINMVSAGKYNNAPDKRKKGFKKNKVAVIYAEGDIVDGKGDENNIASEDYVKLIEKVRTDENVKAIVLRVNSGGGSALASEVMWRELLLAKEKGIPVVASMADVAASGGYYISCLADTIVAGENTITGSIGVFGMLAEAGKFFDNKLGMTFDTVKTTNFSDFPNSLLMSRPITDAEKTILQRGVDRIYNSFLGRVADGRGMAVNAVAEVAQGRVWTGTQAKQKGLVDVIGGMEDAIEIAAKMAGLNEGDYRTAAYPPKEEVWDKILKGFSEETSQRIFKQQLGENYRYLQMLQNLNQLQGAQCRMPFDLYIE
ncbi:signal peptide peptidase SppA [Sphingobacteriales bacterium UPWRP_1]|nr:signal peptide peptidase SppA [Sphingobacteriales bacterium TSM_CSS]PSJ74022.1 signal peptide peptidase SppA [Sphingobacteriales bacterium UPWRP_1]